MRSGLACVGVLVGMALGIAGCSDGEELGVSEPVGEASAVAAAILEAPAEVHPEEASPTAAPTVAPGTEYAEWLAKRNRGIARYTPLPNNNEPEPEPRPDTLPWVEFPDGIALVGRAIPSFAYPYEGFQTELLRIYKRDGQLVRETLFTPLSVKLADHELYADYVPPRDISGADSWGEILNHISAPDGSSIIMTVCVLAPCWRSLEYTEETPSPTAIYESQDGGISWNHLASFDLPWVASSVLDGKDENGQTRVMLRAIFPFFQDDEGIYSQYPADPFMLWPSGERGKRPEDLHLSEDEDAEMVESCPDCLSVSDELQLLSYHYTHEELLGGAAPVPLASSFNSFGNWLTIRNSNTLEQWPIRLPSNVIGSSLHWISPLAIQQGPFLRVVDDVGDCLPVLADPSLDAEELACMVSRVLLTDLGEAMEIEGATWHRVRTPAGIEGWAGGGHLE